MNNVHDDIERYTSGNMTSAEMNAFEKRALNDPFLAEAMQGIEAIDATQLQDDIHELHHALDQKIKSKPESSTGFWKLPVRIAAGVALLFVSGYIITHLVNTNDVKNNSLALNKKEAAETQPSPVINDTVTADPLPHEKKEKPIAIEKLLPPISKQKADADETKDQPSVAAAPPAEAVGEGFAMEDEIAAEEVIRNEPALSRVASSRKAEKKTEIQSAPSEVQLKQYSGIESKTIRGKVSDQEDGQPLPGVNVMVKGTSIGTVTDLNGNYELTIEETNPALVFSFVGMETKEVSSANSATVDVNLNPDVSSLSEVVVVGYGTKEEEEFEGTRWELAEPEGGKKEYKNYLEKSLTYPKEAIANHVEGRVTIQFTILPGGELTDFRVMRSLGFGCDEEVMRLIKEGPQWKPTKRNDEPVKGRGKVKMKFSLPDKK